MVIKIMNMIVAVVTEAVIVVGNIVGTIIAWICTVELVDVLDVIVDLIELLQHGLELLATKALSPCKPTIVVRSLLGHTPANRFAKRWRVQGRCCNSSAHQVLVDVRVVAAKGQLIKDARKRAQKPSGLLAGASMPFSSGVTKPYMH